MQSGLFENHGRGTALFRQSLSCSSCLEELARLCCCLSAHRYTPSHTSEQGLLENRFSRPLNNTHHGGSGPEAPMQPPMPAVLSEYRSAERETERAALIPKGYTHSAEKGDKKAGKTLTRDISLGDLDDACPTCLEAYTPENPRVMAKCGHHYHLPCIYEWLERSPTCPMCGRKMECEELR